MRPDLSKSLGLESAISAVVQAKIALSGIFADRQNSGRSSAGGWSNRVSSDFV